MAKLTKEERQAIAGIPDSQVFADPKAPAFPEHLRGRHVGGRPCEDLPPEVWAFLSIQHTDEDIEERNRGKKEGAARVTADASFEKKVQQRGDFLGTHIEAWEAPDPMKELAKRYVPAGYRARFLSPTVCEKGARGTRGFEVVKENGEPVKLGTLMLAMMPEDKARQRNAHYQRLAAEQLQHHQEQQQQEQARMSRDTGGHFGPLRSNDTVTGRLGIGDGEGDRFSRDYTPTAELGLRQSRGNSILTE